MVVEALRDGCVELAAGRLVLVDCTLRDGGYHNAWDFSPELIQDYLDAMAAIPVDYVELGFRSMDVQGFRGGCAYTTDGFIRLFNVPDGLKLGVMVNVAELSRHPDGVSKALGGLFTESSDSPVSLVRLACHFDEFDTALDACSWLQRKGYLVSLNIMQVADRSEAEIEDVANRASERPPDVLYFADSMGGLDADGISRIVSVVRRRWSGSLGVHTHDNMGRALTNTLRAIAEGVSWVDATVTGMGRGPGNARMENLAIEVSEIRATPIGISPLLALISDYFRKMQDMYGWGTNPYYYLAGKYGIHPTYIQVMLSDSRYMSDDILSVIEHLREVGGKHFQVDELEIGRNFYCGAPSGSWAPAEMFQDRQVLVLGSGPGVAKHRAALTQLIEVRQPLVVALNADLELADELVDLRVASHPFRLLSNSDVYLKFSQPLVAPVSAFPESVSVSLEGKEVLDFGLVVEPDVFNFGELYCVLPTSLTAFYSLALAVSGGAREILLAGFDGYPLGDQRNGEIGHLLETFLEVEGVPPVTAITPTVYPLSVRSVYSML